jgi:hypothetical protein
MGRGKRRRNRREREGGRKGERERERERQRERERPSYISVLTYSSLADLFAHQQPFLCGTQFPLFRWSKGNCQ